ncbi:MAG: hypothetical protein FRX49_08474 [Trebouxia sp. A1-2]|nr:MAG: hypothetical protein FRX49_08474 [Trebouxia sp. A1-2]
MFRPDTTCRIRPCRVTLRGGSQSRCALAPCRQLRGDSDLVAQHVEDRQLSEEAHEHQRILAELEQVHQLRERMLQVASTYAAALGTPAPAPSTQSSECLHDNALACSAVQGTTPDTATSSTGAVSSVG